MLSAGTSNPVNYNVPALICTEGHMWSALDKPAIVYEASAAARAYGIQKSSIIEICSGDNPKRKTAGGRRFRYV